MDNELQREFNELEEGLIQYEEEIEEDYEDEDSEDYDNVESSNSTKKSKPTNVIYGMVLAVLLLVSLFVYADYKFFNYNSSKLSFSHVYVCDNPNNLSEFDHWIKEDLNVSWVPSYVVIKDGQVLGAFDGCIDESEFSNKLGTCLSLNMPYIDLPDLEIENLSGDRKSVKSIFSNGTYILEIHWVDCKDCISQDENYTEDIYKKYGTDIFYRYYIKSEKEKVVNKYQ